MKCLDSDFLIALLRGEKSALSTLEKLKKEEVAITAVNAFELYVGAFVTGRMENVVAVSDLLDSYTFFDFEKKSTMVAGKVMADLEKRGSKIGWRDCIVAAIAITNGCSLITRNVKHFSKVKGLTVEKW